MSDKETSESVNSFIDFANFSSFLNYDEGSLTNNFGVFNDKLREKEKKRRKVISLEHKEIIVNAYKEGGNLHELSSQLDISIFSIRSIISRYKTYNKLSIGKRGGNKSKHVDRDSYDKVLECIDRNYVLSVSDLKNLMEEQGAMVSRESLESMLKTQFITCKVERALNLLGCWDTIKQLRYAFVKRLLTEQWRCCEMIFVEDFNVCLWSDKLKDLGSDNFANDPCNGWRASVVIAISKKGVVHYEMIPQIFDEESYENFLKSTSKKLPNEKRVIIHNHSGINHEPVLSNKSHQVVSFPPYSSFLSPIDYFLSDLKNKIRKSLTGKELSATQKEEKFELMQNLIIKDIVSSRKDLQVYYRQIKKHFVDCIEKNDIFVE